jgi:hypothetical protein
MTKTTSTIVLIALIVFAAAIIMSVALDMTGDYRFSRTITVTDKQPYGTEQMQLFNGSVKYRAPGYLWNDIVVGQTYNVTGSTVNIFGYDGTWIVLIEKVD